MVARDIVLAELTGAHVHIAHVSTAGAVRLVRDAKARGVRVTARGDAAPPAPHRRGACAATTPTPRWRRRCAAKRDVEALPGGARRRHHRLHRHRPRAPRASARRRSSSTRPPSAIVGLETAVPLLLDAWCGRGVSTWPRWSRGSPRTRRASWACRAAASPRGAGRRDDPRSRAGAGRSSPRAFRSKSRNTPFGGWALRGRAVDDHRRRRSSSGGAVKRGRAARAAPTAGSSAASRSAPRARRRGEVVFNTA